MSRVIDFFDQSIQVPEAGCWIWAGYLSTSGYGRIMFDGKVRQATRVCWEQIHSAIPEGMQVCHKCDTRSCVNPDHLFLGTSKQNHDDMMLKGRSWQAQLTHCFRGHELSGSNVRFYRNNERTCMRCKRIRNRKSYRKTTSAQGASDGR